MAKLVDALGLGPSGATLESSSLSVRTNKIMFYFLQNFTPNRILIDLGVIKIYWYGFLLALAMTVAIFLVLKLAKSENLKENDLIDLFFFLIIGGLFGARIYDVFLQLPYYINNPWHIFMVWKGGLAIHGAIISGLIILYFFSKKRNLNFWRLAAILSPALALGQAIGRYGNYFNQELFGKPTKLPWGIIIEKINRPNGFENFTHFHPTFLYESFGLLIIFVFLLYLFKKLKNNEYNNILIVSLYVLLYSILRFSLEFIKIDITPQFLFLRWPQVMSIILVVIATILLIYAKNKKHKKS